MLRPRIIPCLLIKNGGLVKTVRFDKPKYIGDPINAVRIFNEKEVDELIITDIDASTQNREPDYNLIRRIAAECRMPLCYAGGIRSPEQVERIISLGVEKVGISSSILSKPTLISDSAKRVGNQSIVAILDVKKTGIFRRYEVFTHNGTKSTGISPFDLAKQAQSLGAGEILINAIDQDGIMNGYDHELIDQVRAAVNLPLSALGGAGSLSDIESLIRRYGVIGAAAGSLFVFKGKYRAVLINYPSQRERELLYSNGNLQRL